MKTSNIITNHKICRALRGKMASSSSSSSSTSSTASTAVVAASAPAAMAANQLPQQQDLHTDLLMQRQQQELIKLLAQHFHHQFYQMTSVNQTNPDQPNLNSPPSSDTLNINTSQQPIQSSYHQQQRSHYSQEQIPFNSSSLNISATVGNHQMSQNNHPLRSQSTSSGPHSTGGCNPMNNTSESRDYLEYSNQNLASAYPINDLSLFNALGLNLTNNQLVLSLQQQQHSLLQAAAMRQSELKNGFESLCHRNISNNDELLAGINQTKNGEIEHQDTILNHQQQQQQNQHRPDRKHNLLKFSINTILGSSGGCGTSPNCNGSSTGDAKSNPNFMQSTNQSSPSALVNRVGNFSGREEVNLLDSEQQLCVEVIDCDHIESSSDSSSLNASTSSSIPQSANLLQSLTSADHRCAKIVGDVNSFSQVGNTQHPLRQQHPQSIQQHHYHNQPLPFLPGSTAFPWTVAARGKPRRGMMRRAVFSDSQRVGLEKRFQLQKYISKPDRKKLAEKLGLRDSQVKIWFQNRRMKWRNSKERELLSAGGSREQTLPTRNNPNPDLSDVGETIKRISNSTTATPTVP